ncbi:MAG TPA: sensor histidine kinase [Streptosporangiaceae bacterium]
MDPLLKALRERHWIAIDVACTVLLVLVYGVGFNLPADLTGVPRGVAVLIAATAVLPVAARRRWPRAALALVVLAGAVVTALSFTPVPPLAAAFVVYLIPLRFARRETLWLLAFSLLATAAGDIAFGLVRHGVYRPGGTRATAGLLLESGLLLAGAWMIGYLARLRRTYSAGLREQAGQRAREQLAEARRASSEERLRIARELHDVVAHSMSMIAVQAGVASYVAGAAPEETARALSSIEETSRGALREMRALLGVLRDEGTSDAGPGAGLIPAPGLAGLKTLADRTAEAGVVVDLDIHGDRPPLPAGLDLAAYRVIQEAITNVIKHAATARCRVAVGYAAKSLDLEITDNGIGGAPSTPGPGTGHGITGMRERVGMYGGEFSAAPRPGGGFRVSARFPLTGAAA